MLAKSIRYVWCVLRLYRVTDQITAISQHFDFDSIMIYDS